ncbi:starch synthase, partial [Salmonella enterica subsp. enterica serovar Bovismorbificans]|nr:starch synthase [Salmonella enterica subsp. enterica serovar Bovismorbificans]
MQVLHVCSELFPLLKTGGLADVLGALPAAQIADGVDTRVLLPGFPDLRRGVADAKVITLSLIH